MGPQCVATLEINVLPLTFFALYKQFASYPYIETSAENEFPTLESTLVVGKAAPVNLTFHPYRCRMLAIHLKGLELQTTLSQLSLR
jgi:hypothetical protein